ncbi:MAG: histidine kinase, partial [Chloroflexota bacterium]
SLRCAAATVSLQVLDDGCGFDSAAIAAGHFGVQIMEERAAEVGADLTIDTRPGEGTALQLIWSRTI